MQFIALHIMDQYLEEAMKQKYIMIVIKMNIAILIVWVHMDVKRIQFLLEITNQKGKYASEYWIMKYIILASKVRNLYCREKNI